MNKKWFSVQDLVGQPFLPQAEHHIRRHLEKMLAGREDLKRKRKGSKAYEYNISIFPAHIQQALGATLETGLQTETEKESSEELSVWLMIFKRMTAEQKKQAIEIFFDGGIKELMPAVADIGNPARKEILGQYSEPGRVETAGDSVGPQDMKKAG
ncbi:hypothetical protein YN18_001209 [Salmonella enterica subsp. enterica]|uniref:hypothetical protein n=1 Tax=Salmonella enterica TaxID=28901 RepID=UPI000FA4BC05|nr:hypothetical protein [Salmonella enterica subsp. enterica]EKE2594372.1 hypothetical protein [Salmonella enterica]HCM2492348.1 hypothetical protein [Salmonella enterica subsp. enterica serovar Lehrte]EDR2888272.1 hypothetical protein [Salmonella enterica subsp. enterica]EDR6140793.1 hypothetical protein [Salmonella enterica subsp. enterica]